MNIVLGASARTRADIGRLCDDVTMKVAILIFSFKRGLPEDKIGNGAPFRSVA